MKLVNGEIVPGVKIGNYVIGEKKDAFVAIKNKCNKIREREDGSCIYYFDNFILWFDDNVLTQIGVTSGFLGSYDSIHIGSTMQDIVERFGNYIHDDYVYLIPKVEGLCFELEDVDEWDELTAPIEWIFVYKE